VQYLSKNKHDIYQVRIRVANRLLPYFNRHEIIKSLGTKKYQEAKQVAFSFISPYQSIDLITRTTLLTDYQIQELVETYMRDVLKISTSTKDLMQQPNLSAKMTNEKARKTKNMSQLDLSLKLGHKSVSIVASAERFYKKKHFNIEHLIKISYILEVDICEFFKPIE